MLNPNSLKAKPADNYDDLKKQFFALKNLCESKIKQCSIYSNKLAEYDRESILARSEALESEKEMNAQLTEELAKANERVKELEKSEEKERLRKEYAFRMEENLIEENKQLKRQRFRTYNDEEYIIFFDDGEDYPESMVAPVVMSADKFRELFYAREQLAKVNERVDGLEKALANCADALHESNINHKKAIDKIQAECIDVLFDFAAKRDDSGFAIALYEQPYEIQDAIRTFKQLRKEQE